VNGTAYTMIPSCEQSRGTDCRIYLDDLAMVWSTIDLMATFFVCIAFVWLRLFEQREIVTIERDQVSPADYTVLVSNLPADCSEMSLRAHFAQLLVETIEEIIFVEDNALDIAMFEMRGDLVKKRYKLTQVFSPSPQRTCIKLRVIHARLPRFSGVPLSQRDAPSPGRLWRSRSAGASAVPQEGAPSSDGAH
jgi:hypothetical protein